MTDCDRCGEHCLDCKCTLDSKIDRFRKRGLIGCLNTECHKTGCRSLETRCTDCGRVVNTTMLTLNYEDKQSNPQNSTEIPTNQGNSGWIEMTDRKPEDGQMIAAVSSGVYYWIGYYDPSDKWTHWIPLPKLP